MTVGKKGPKRGRPPKGASSMSSTLRAAASRAKMRADGQAYAACREPIRLLRWHVRRMIIAVERRDLELAAKIAATLKAVEQRAAEPFPDDC